MKDRSTAGKKKKKKEEKEERRQKKKKSLEVNVELLDISKIPP